MGRVRLRAAARPAYLHQLTLVDAAQAGLDLRGREEENVVDPIEGAVPDEAPPEFQDREAKSQVSHLVDVEVMVLVDHDEVPSLFSWECPLQSQG